MELQLLNGTFSSKESIDILNQLFQVKIKFHEDKISRLSNLEEIKMREQRIKELQRMQSKIHDWLKAHGEQTNLELTLSVG